MVGGLIPPARGNPRAFDRTLGPALGRLAAPKRINESLAELVYRLAVTHHLFFQRTACSWAFLSSSVPIYFPTYGFSSSGQPQLRFLVWIILASGDSR